MPSLAEVLGMVPMKRRRLADLADREEMMRVGLPLHEAVRGEMPAKRPAPKRTPSDSVRG